YLRLSKLCMVDTCRLAIRLEVEFLRVGVASSVPANNGSLISKNPCTQAGNAPDPSVYQQKGQTAQNNAVADILPFPVSRRRRSRRATPGSIARVRKLCVRGVHECCGIHAQSGSFRGGYLCRIPSSLSRNRADGPPGLSVYPSSKCEEHH